MIYGKDSLVISIEGGGVSEVGNMKLASESGFN